MSLVLARASRCTQSTYEEYNERSQANYIDCYTNVVLLLYRVSNNRDGKVVQLRDPVTKKGLAGVVEWYYILIRLPINFKKCIYGRHCWLKSIPKTLFYLT
jgi:hypothetical protein